MKRRRLTPIILLAATLFGVSAIPIAQASSSDDSANTSDAPAPQIVTSNDPATVYTKAFWRRPSPGDRILHAERREWRDATGAIVNWQWFLVVEPSQQTLDWLATNPFLLKSMPASHTAPSPTEPPDWFRSESLSSAPLQDATGHHVLAISPNGKRLYATDWGSGFARANAATSPESPRSPDSPSGDASTRSSPRH